ncbi:cytochrome P450 2G1-like isoform X1 [Anolis sagrei]|uniref:cytochrome P450 2G1-like isoform X1 n=1 Tax=Anolis sagrei TaxID=38937 RepID=UPI0035204429
MELEWVLSISLGICLVLVSAWKWKHKEVRFPPGPMPLPFLGNLLQLNPKDLPKSLLALSHKYGPVYTLYLGPRRVVVLCGHEALKEALVDHGEQFCGRGKIAPVERTFKGLGIVMANGERWKKLRHFTLVTLKNFGMGKCSIEERIQEEAQYLLEKFRKTKGLPFDPTYLLNCTTSNIICSIVFGRRFEYEDKTFLSMLDLTNKLFFELSTPWIQFCYDMYSGIMQYLPGGDSRIYNPLQELKALIDERIKINQETLDLKNPRDFIDCFLIEMEKEKGNPSPEFTVNSLALTALNLFTAGTDTVSSTLKYALLLMMKYPEVEEKVHQEIDNVIGRNRVPAVKDRVNMPYTNAVIHEIQRLVDILPAGLPHKVTEDTEFRGYLLPKDTNIITLLGSALHDPQYFSDPEIFNPQHFLDEEGCFKKIDAFVPFSSGKRACVGESMARMELFLYFTTILQSFSLKSSLTPTDIDITPQQNGFLNVPPIYELCLIPR